MYDAIVGPDVLPTGNANDIDFSPGNKFLAIAHNTTPFVSIYNMSEGYPIKIPNPSVLPASQGNGVAFSFDGKWLAVAHNNAPFLTLYEINGNEFNAIPQLPTGVRPAGNANKLVFTPDSKYLIVGHAVTPFISIYDLVSEDTPVRMANPDVLPTGAVLNLDITPGGNRIVSIGGGLRIYTIQDGILTQVIATTIVQSRVAISPDGRYVAHGGSQTINQQSNIVLGVNDTILDTFQWVHRNSDLPPGNNASSVKFSPDGNFLIVGSNVSPFLTFYFMGNQGIFTKLPDLSIHPTGTPNAITYSKDYKFLGIAHSTSPFMTLYLTGKDMPEIVPIEDIIPMFSLSNRIGVRIPLVTQIIPSNATNQFIRWSIVDDGNTGATIDWDIELQVFTLFVPRIPIRPIRVRAIAERRGIGV